MRSLSIIIVILLFCESYGFGQQNSGTWDRIWEMKPGAFRVMKNGQIGIIDGNDNILVPISFDQVYDLDENNYVRVIKDLKIGLYHLERGIILPTEYDQIWPFVNERAKVLKNRRLGYVGMDGSIVIPCEFNHIWPEEEGLYKVLKDGKMGLISIYGETILPAEYQQIGSFENGLAMIVRDGKAGFVDRTGLAIIPPVYDHVSDFKNGMTRAQKGDSIVLLDTNGRIAKTEEQAVQDNQNLTEPSKPDNGISHPTPAIKIGRDQVEVKKDDQVKEFTFHHFDRKNKKRPKYFEGHLESLNIGINSYVDRDFKENVPQGYEFMELIHEKSVEVSIYPWQESLRIIGSQVGLVSTIGIQYNNYRFDLNDLSDLNETTIDWFPPFSETARVGKAKLTALSLNVPVMLEFQIPNNRNNENFYVGAGVIGGLRLKSHTKIIYHDDRSSFKRKKRDDFDLNTFRYSYIARVGYNNFGIYGTYSPISLFRNEKGPDLYPFSIGVSFNFN
jgi:hypothetical protein